MTSPDRGRTSAAALERTNERLRLLLGAARGLLASERPGDYVQSLFAELARQVGVDAYFSYLVEERDGEPRLRLEGSAGVPEEVVREWEWLEFGSAVCGTVAQDGRRAVIGDVQASTAPETALIRSLGITAYVCHPLVSDGRLVGTLSFGRRGRPRFDEDELDLLQGITDQVAVAIARYRAHREERRLREAAEQASRAKTRFLAIMSHELRTPLNAVLGYQELLATAVPGPLNDTQRAHLDRIRSAGLQLLGLIDQILSLSRIEAGKEEVQRLRFDLPQLVREAAAMVTPEAAGKGLLVEIRAPERLVLDSDPGKVRQIVLNLLGNAIRYTRDGRVDLDVAALDGHAVCRVRDTGPGIAAVHLERIFEPFEQVDDALTRERKGTGLGLAVSRRLARLLGGDVVVESTPGGGSTFTLSLPLGV